MWCLDALALNREANLNFDFELEIPAAGSDSVLTSYLPSHVQESPSELSPLAIIGPRNTTRMAAQLGCFTINHRRHTPIEEINRGQHVWRWNIPARAKGKILRELALLGYTGLDKPLRKRGRTYDYAIIDGKQRLETVWSFIDGYISLASGFDYFRDSKVKSGEMTYSELGEKYPDLKAQFDGFRLHVVAIETDELEMIEEMFSRLNESAPLTAAEKRNAFGGPLPMAIRKLATHPFFTRALPFPNKRYRHFDLAAKFLFSESEDKVTDTKKAYLDEFVRNFNNKPRQRMPSFFKSSQQIAARMNHIFQARDPLLQQVGIVVLYYHLFRIAREGSWLGKISRKKLADFERDREMNRRKAERDITQAAYNLLEFDRYSQSPNDSYAIKFRLSILLNDVFGKKVSMRIYDPS